MINYYIILVLIQIILHFCFQKVEKEKLENQRKQKEKLELKKRIYFYLTILNRNRYI